MTAPSLPATMNAVGIRSTGGPEVIEHFADFPVPTPKPNEVLIKVEYSGLNFLDTVLRTGGYPLPPLPVPLGLECAGTVVGLPTDADVLANPRFAGRKLQIGSKVVGYGMSTQAEYASVSWETAVALPENVSTRVGAAAFVQGLTALSFVEEAYKVQKGDYVLVHTVAGGVGLFFAQLIAARGGIVIGTTSTPEKAALAKRLGAAHVILYKTEDVVARVLEITGGAGVHAIFDGVGKDTFEANFNMIREKGTIVVLGQASGPVPAFQPGKLTQKNVKFLYPTADIYVRRPAPGHDYLKELYELIANGSLEVPIYKEYPFTAEGVREAHIDLAGGKTTGKLLIKVA